MNILLVTETYFPYITGVSVSTNSIAKFMVSRGHKVTLVCPKPVVKGEVEPLAGLTIVNVPSIPFSFYNLGATAIFPLAFPIIEKLMNETKFDLVHIQEPGTVGIVALIKANAHQIPIIGALHFIPEQIDRVLWGKFEKILTPAVNVYIRYVYNKYDAIMTPSRFFANYLKNIGIKRPINVISNGTNIEKFHPAARNENLRKKLGFSKHNIVFFFLGRLDRDKNVETLVRAMPYTDTKVEMLVVGKGTEKKFLHNLAKKLKIEDRITWVDYIKNSEMPDFYHAADVFSIMSPYEGQSIVTLQAVASGLPVIAARASALPELCHDHENGFLVDTYDYKTLATKIDELVHNKKIRAEFGKESRKISLNHHKPKVLHKLELLYQKISRR